MVVAVTPRDIEGVRMGLPPAIDQYCDDDMVTRYIRATGGDIEKAAQRLNVSVEWRKEVEPEKVICPACVKDPSSHYMQVVGFCKLQRPVMYSCMHLSPNKNTTDGKLHMISKFEQAIRMMPKGVEQWIWFSDFHGFGMADLNPAMARIFLDMSATHYPERLGVYFLVDTPRIFELLWKIVKPLLDPVTAKKLVFVPYDANGKGKTRLVETLSEYFEPDLVDWLVKEMAENRDKKKCKGKCFDAPSTYKFASEGALSNAEPHDSRGTGKVLKMYEADPSLLLPQAKPEL